MQACTLHSYRPTRVLTEKHTPTSMDFSLALPYLRKGRRTAGDLAMCSSRRVPSFRLRSFHWFYLTQVNLPTNYDVAGLSLGDFKQAMTNLMDEALEAVSNALSAAIYVEVVPALSRASRPVLLGRLAWKSRTCRTVSPASACSVPIDIH